MGKIEVCGIAERTIDYDLMKLEVKFQARKDTPEEASECVMKECEEFLAALKADGTDLSGIALGRDEVEDCRYYTDDGKTKAYYAASRMLEIITPFNMTAVNRVRSIINAKRLQAVVKTTYLLSNSDKIKQELLVEALKDAAYKADLMAAAIDQRVIELVTADKNAPSSVYNSLFDGIGSCLCCQITEDEEYEEYDNSDELKASTTTLSETIYTTWEIG